MSKRAPNKSISKSKRTSNRARVKKKNITIGEPSSSSNSSCSSEKMQFPVAAEVPEVEKVYDYFNSDTIECLGEQFLGEHVDEAVCNSLAEDATYRIREIIKAACSNMRHSKRNFIREDDINAAFNKFHLERIHGVSDSTWVNIEGDEKYFFWPETTVDLLEEAKCELVAMEPGDIGINYKWMTDDSVFNQILINNNLNNYSQQIMNAVVSNKKTLRKVALKDVATNLNIGPLIPQFCNFCFLILQKNITYSSYIKPTLEFLEAIMFNPCTGYSVNEKQMTLLIYLLLENIINATNEMLDDVIPICRILGHLCINWIRGTQVVIDKLTKYLSLDEPVRRLTAPVICALSYVGYIGVDTLVWKHIVELFFYMEHIDQYESSKIDAALLTASTLMFKRNICETTIYTFLDEVYGDTLTPILFLNPLHYIYYINDELSTEELSVQNNWIYIKLKLAKTLKVLSKQQISNRISHYKLFFEKTNLSSNIIIIKKYKALPINKKTFSQLETPVKSEKDYVNIITGKRTLFPLKKIFTFHNSSCKKNIRDMMYMI